MQVDGYIIVGVQQFAAMLDTAGISQINRWTHDEYIVDGETNPPACFEHKHAGKMLEKG